MRFNVEWLVVAVFCSPSITQARHYEGKLDARQARGGGRRGSPKPQVELPDASGPDNPDPPGAQDATSFSRPSVGGDSDTLYTSMIMLDWFHRPKLRLQQASKERSIRSS